MAALSARHVLDRMGCGWSPQDEALVAAAGGPAAWFEAQLVPSAVAESTRIPTIDGWFGYLADTPATRLATPGADRGLYRYGLGLASWTLLRRIYGRRSVLETMVDFWSDHFHVSANHGYAWVHRFAYDQTIRQHALGRFEDLLVACALHPAMRLYLDNWLSVAGDPNENQGRELLELHTVGVDTGYTEDMVKDSAKVLSGYTVDWGRTYDPVYDPTRHTTGAVKVLGFKAANAAADGRAVTTAYLSYLARHPATARRLARKLATRFVADDPPNRLVRALTTTYLSSGTDIAAVLRTLVGSEDFLRSAGGRVRRPADDLVATAKVLGVEVQAPTDPTGSAANALTLIQGGDRLFTAERPDGPPIPDPPWSSAGRMFASFTMHSLLAGGYYPTKDVTYRTAESWLPATEMSFAAYVDQLCRRLLGTPADARLVAVATQAMQGLVGAQVGPTRPITEGYLVRLISALLDTPDHMTR